MHLIVLHKCYYYQYFQIIFRDDVVVTGFNIKPKQIYSKIKIIDIAPTLSIFLKTAFPNACTGNPIGEIF